MLLAFVPRLPSADSSHGFGLASGSLRITGSTARRQRVFAVTQIAASFVLLAGASMLLKTLLALQAAQTGFDTRHVLAMNVPVMSYGKTPEQIVGFYQEAHPANRRIAGRGSRRRRHHGAVARCRHLRPGIPVLGRRPRARAGRGGSARPVPHRLARASSRRWACRLSPAAISTTADREGSEPVVIVSQSLAQRMFPNQDAVNRHLMWTDPVMKFIDISTAPRRIVGVAADVDDENVVPGPAMTVYHPFGQEQLWGGRLFVHARGNPYALVTPITRIIRDMSADQLVERAATLEDIRAEVLTPDRLNTMVFGGFAAVALAIAVVGVAGRAGVFGQRTDARVRHPAGDRIAAAAPADGRDCAKALVMAAAGRCGRRGVRIRAGAAGGQLFPGDADARSSAGSGLCDRADCARRWSHRCCRRRAPLAWTSCRRCGRIEPVRLHHTFEARSEFCPESDRTGSGWKSRW